MDKKTLNKWLDTLTKISVILEDYQYGGITKLQELCVDLDDIIDELYNQVKRK